MQKTNHQPVLLNQILNNLSKRRKSAFDGTLGGGGHTQLLIQYYDHVTSCDLDSAAIARFREYNSGIHIKKLTLVRDSYHKAIESIEMQSLDFCLLDLGFSSDQLENGGRGFSYRKEQEPLDLRYDATNGVSCAVKLTKVKSEKTLRDILYRASGEELSGPIARKLYAVSRMKLLLVKDAKEAVESAIPNKFFMKKNSILSRVWQALRIWTNNEFSNIEHFLSIAPSKLAPGGRLAIICFHSLEDKIVTKAMRELSRKHVVDEYGNTMQYFQFLTKKPIVPDSAEIASNDQSRSAMLRIIEKLG